MASIKFVLKSDKSPAAIYVRLINGVKTDVMAKTNFVINPADWSKAKQQPKNLTNPDFKSLNTKLTDLKADLLKHYNNSNGKVDINTKWLKDFINPQATHNLPLTLIGYIEHYAKVKKGKVSDSTLQKYSVIKKKLIRFQEHKGKTILIKDINSDFQHDFEEYCKEHNYASNTVAREVRFIKTVCRHAQKNGVEVHYQVDSLEIQYHKVDSIYLTEAELIKVKEAKLSDSLDNVRDWLIISCYTGQRISDFLRFDKSMIRTEKNRKGKTVYLIEFVQKKTGKIMTLPLHQEVLAILKKREGNFPPRITDQRYNEFVKTVCKKAGIDEMVKGSMKVEITPKSKIYRKETGVYPKWQLVTSHIGRRSFATNFYGIIPTPLLMNATGHSTEKMLLNYIGKSSSDMAKEIYEYF